MSGQSLVVPAVFEANLASQDGSAGFSLPQALTLQEECVPNVYSMTGNEFKFDFTETGVAYNETQSSNMNVRVSFKVEGSAGDCLVKVNTTPVVQWGINFAGSVSCEDRVMYLPGSRSYDPAGLTGDPHASERIGPSCSRTQLAVTIAELVAVSSGATASDICAMQQATLPLITRYHGREALFRWMGQQVCEAILEKKEVTPYPEFIKQEVQNGRLELSEARQHTREYLESYNRGQASPPVHYYRKVAKKDNVSELFSASDLTKFNQLIQ